MADKDKIRTQNSISSTKFVLDTLNLSVKIGPGGGGLKIRGARDSTRNKAGLAPAPGAPNIPTPLYCEASA